MKFDPEALKNFILEKLRANQKLVKSLLTGLGIAAVLGLGYFGYRMYIYHTGPQKALEQLAKALKSSDAETLANCVDFSSLGDNIGEAIAQAYGQKYIDGKPVLYNEEVQKAFLKALLDNKAGDKKDDTKKAPPSFQLPPPPPTLPPDFIAQLGIFKMINEHDGVVLLSSSVHHEGLNTVFNIIAQVEKTKLGWQVTRLANAPALVKKYRDAMHDFFDRQDAAVTKKNEQVTKRMENAFQIQSCQTVAGLVGDGSRGMMTINISAFNLSDKAINSVNMLLDVTDQNDELVRQVRLNSSDKVYPGDSFKSRWVMELDPKSTEYAPLLKAARLSCKPVLKAMTLGSEVIWITELKNHDDEY